VSRPLTTRSMRVKVTKCRVTGKRRYRDEVDALISMSGMRTDREKAEKRPFPCKHCKGFHLTALTVEEYNERKASFERGTS
jgi:hypothetical protein